MTRKAKQVSDDVFIIRECTMMHGLARGVHHFDCSEFGDSRALLRRGMLQDDHEVLLITCSSIGALPQAFFPQIPTSLQILQNFGNLVKPFDSRRVLSGGVEEVLAMANIRHVVVCGHFPCRFIDLLASDFYKANSPALMSCLSYAERAYTVITNYYTTLQRQYIKEVLAQENVLAQLENLRTLPDLTARLRARSLFLYGWLLTPHELLAYAPDREQFLLEAVLRC